MQTTKTTAAQTTVRIMVPAGAAILGSFGVFTAKAAFEADADEVRGVITDGGGKVILRGVITYVYTRGDAVYSVSAQQAHPVVAPEPEPTPEPPTTTKTTTHKRQSREAQHNAKVQVAYDSIKPMGHDARNDLHELFSVASGSLVGLRYTVTHDTVTGRLHCTCLAGQHERGTCVHRQAVTRWLNERAVKINAAADRAVQQRLADMQRDTSPLRRSSKPFSMMA